jgi:predicted CXXCH cytochrome family protein
MMAQPLSVSQALAMRRHLRIDLCLLTVLLLVGCEPAPDVPVVGEQREAEFVGSVSCAACHADQTRAWQSSHHYAALQQASADTVLGDFADAELTRGEVTTKFFRRDGGYWIATDGGDGSIREFRVRYTFGVDPLQQYLVELDGGRYQAVTIAWDARPAQQGGQRWFDLQSGEVIAANDPLHWTKVSYNWNSSCADCHSTHLVKNLDPATGDFETTFSSDSVGCEACHGAGSLHVAAPMESRLVLGRDERAWILAAGARIAQRAPLTAGDAEIEVCAQCHARRMQLSDAYEPGKRLLDSYRPALLDVGLYHSDGQILDEVFEYGSFVQSRMHAAGVTCTDCHDPHSGNVRATDNTLCTSCHTPSAFDTPEHHRHTPAQSGSLCVDCHMRERPYMVVDPRHDHSFRVPRPDLSVKLGVPNACNACHADRTATWAAETVASWFPAGRAGEFHYGEALQAGRSWAVDRNVLLRRVIEDGAVPAIARATAVSLLAAQLDDADIELVGNQLRDDAPLVRLAAIEALAATPVGTRVDLVQRFLSDPAAELRMAAARVLIPARDALTEPRRRDLDAALAELIAAHEFNADRVEGLLNLGNLQAEMQSLADAEATYARALEQHPEFAPVYVNLAEVYRLRGRESDAEALLRRGIEVHPQDPSLRHALGLSLVRSNRLEDALTSLREASDLGREDPLYAYVYGIALNSTGATEQALAVLADGHDRFPGYAPLLVMLASIHRDAGDVEAAGNYVLRLLELVPSDPSVRALAAELNVSRTQ